MKGIAKGGEYLIRGKNVQTARHISYTIRCIYNILNYLLYASCMLAPFTDYLAMYEVISSLVKCPNALVLLELSPLLYIK